MNYIEEHKATSAVIGIIIVGGIIYVAYSYKQPAGNVGSVKGSSQNTNSQSANDYNANVTSLNLARNKNKVLNNENILAYNASVNATKANIIKEKLQANVEKYDNRSMSRTKITLGKLSLAALKNSNMLAYNNSVNKTAANILQQKLNANMFRENLSTEQNMYEIGANKDIINSKLALIGSEKRDNTMQKIAYLNNQAGIYRNFNQSQAQIDNSYYNAQSHIGVANAKAGAAEKESYNKYAYPAYEQMLEYIDK